MASAARRPEGFMGSNRREGAQTRHAPSGLEVGLWEVSLVSSESAVVFVRDNANTRGTPSILFPARSASRARSQHVRPRKIQERAGQDRQTMFLPGRAQQAQLQSAGNLLVQLADIAAPWKHRLRS